MVADRSPRISGTITRTAALSGATFQESIAINGKRYLSVYDTLARTLVETTPALRSRTMHFDAAGRLLDASPGGVITPVTFQYFPDNSPYKGRLSHVAQGTRAWDYTYDAKGRLFTVRDPALRTTTFNYDLADRVQTIILPGNHIVGYGYNANGALETLTPAGRPAHGYGYSDLDDLSAYTPPMVQGVPSPATTFVHNWDRQLTGSSGPGVAEVAGAGCVAA